MAAPPGERSGDGGRAAAASPHGHAGPRQGPRLRPAPPRHIHSSERLRGAGRRREGGRGEKGGGRGLGRRRGAASQAAAATAPPPRPGGGGKRLRAAAPRRGRGGLPPAAPQPPAAGLEAGASQSPPAGAAQADVGGGGGDRPGAGVVGEGPAAAEASRARRRVRPALVPAGGGLSAAPQQLKVGALKTRTPAAPRPAREAESPLTSAGSAA